MTITNAPQPLTHSTSGNRTEVVYGPELRSFVESTSEQMLPVTNANGKTIYRFPISHLRAVMK